MVASPFKARQLFSTIPIRYSARTEPWRANSGAAIGMATGALLLVVHVYRMEHEHDKEEIIRIISARQANKRECRIYLQQAGE